MKRKTLKTDSERKEFLAKFSLFSSNPVSLTYLRQAQPYGFYLDNILVAGYAVNINPPFRYLDWVPEGPDRENILRCFYSDNQTVEATCFWISKGQVTKFQRNLIYLFLHYDLLKKRRHYIFAGTTELKIGHIHRQALSNVVYHGPLNLPGRPQGEVYYATWGALFKFIAARYIAETYHDLKSEARRF